MTAPGVRAMGRITYRVHFRLLDQTRMALTATTALGVNEDCRRRIMGIKNEFKEAVLEALVEAALGGHDIGPQEPVETVTGGYEAKCRLCEATSWVGDNGLRYSLLEDTCSSREREEL